MSHTLARLRETTGDPLLVRAGRRLVPTPRALSMVEATRDLVAQARAVLAPAAEDEGWLMAGRSFVVAMPDELAIAHGVQLLNAVRSRMPHAGLALLPAGGLGVDRLRQGTVDIEVRAAGELPQEIRMEVLREQPLVVAMRRGHELAGRTMTLPRYVQAEHVSQPPGDGLEEAVERALAEAGVARRQALRVATPYAALAAASRSDLVATAQRSLVQAVARTLGLVFLRFPLRTQGLRTVQVWHPRMDLDPQHAWLRMCIRSVLGPRKPG